MTRPNVRPTDVFLVECYWLSNDGQFPTNLTACVASESILALAGKNSPVIQAE